MQGLVIIKGEMLGISGRLGVVVIGRDGVISGGVKTVIVGVIGVVIGFDGLISVQGLVIIEGEMLGISGRLGVVVIGRDGVIIGGVNTVIKMRGSEVLSRNTIPVKATRETDRVWVRNDAFGPN